jgi:WD40 repeat protein
MGKRKTTLESHGSPISYLLSLPNGNLISASTDGTMNLCSIKGQCIKKLEGHTSCISKLILLQNNNIASCSLNGLIKIWNTSYTCIQTIAIEGFSFLKHLFSLPNNNLVCSAFYQSQPYIMVLDYTNEYKLSKSIDHDGMQVSCLGYMYSSKFASGCNIGIIGLWDVDDGCSKSKKLYGQQGRTSSFAFRDGLLFSGSEDKIIKIWDKKNRYECIKTLEVSGLFVVMDLHVLPNGYLASASYNGKIKIWDRNFECINTFGGCNEFMTILLKDYRIASYVNSKNITLWEY